MGWNLEGMERDLSSIISNLFRGAQENMKNDIQNPD
jgi:hypothetical protein